MADTNVKVVFEMPFLTLSKVKVDFAQRKLIWKTYTAIDGMSTIKKV